MSTPIDAVIAQLQESGLVPPDKLAEFIPPAATPTDPQAWTAQLVARGLLTPFQAAQTANGKAKSLVIGSYEMVDRLTGGGGLLFKARHRRMKRMVMVKPLAPSLMKAAGPRVLADVEVVGRLQHPNVVAVQDVDEVGGAHFLVAEFVEAIELATLVQQQGKLPIATACSYAAQAAVGLAQAHAQGLAHRDVKAENLFVDRNGVVKVLGFGLTAHEGDAAADVAALGRTLLRLLGDIAPPAALGAYVARMTAENPAERPKMADVAVSLAAPDALPQPVAAASAELFPELFAGADDEAPPPVETSPLPELVVAAPPAPVSASPVVTAPVATAPVVAPADELPPRAAAEFAIDSNPAPAPSPAVVVAAVTEAAPMFNINAAATPIVVTEPQPAVTQPVVSPVMPVEADVSDGGPLGISVAPTSVVSSTVASKTSRKPSTVRGKKSALPFKIDPKYLTPKYMIGGGAGVIITLSLALWMVVGGRAAQREKAMPPVKAVKAIPPRSMTPGPSPAPATPAGQQPAPMFNLPVVPAATRPNSQ